MPICNRFHGRLANNGKITPFRKYRFFDVVVVAAHSSSPSLVVVKLEKISHCVWIVP